MPGKKLRGNGHPYVARKGCDGGASPSQPELRESGQRRFVEIDPAASAVLTQPELRGKGQFVRARKGQRAGAPPSQAELLGADRVQSANGHGSSVLSRQPKLRSKGHAVHATIGQNDAAIAVQPELPGNGHTMFANGQIQCAVSRQPELREDGQSVTSSNGPVTLAVPTQSEIIDAIRANHRVRCYAMEARKATHLRLSAYLRSQLGWSMNKSEKERKAIAAQAQALIKNPDGCAWEHIITPSLLAGRPFEKLEEYHLKEMERLAELLPVWKSFGEGVRGFGRGSLAVIVAEAGDLANYSTKSKLWKRMGLAVMDGRRQGHVGNGLSKDDRKAAYIEHGYSPQRRSRVWNIGDALIKLNRDGIYRVVYLKRKEYELARDPEMKPIHAHRRAQRYMEKRLLRDLWQAWGRAGKPLAEQPRRVMPSPEIEQSVAL